MVAAARLAAHVHQVGTRLLEVEVVHHVGAGTNLLGDLPLVDHFLEGVEIAVGGEVADLRVARQGFVRADVVRQHQRVLVPVVREVVVDAFVLHQAAHEGEVGFLVLDAVLPLAVAGAELLLEREAVVGEHLFEDIDHRLVLEDLAVAGAREVPEPRAHGGAIDDIARGAAFLADHREAHDLPVQEAGRARSLDLERQRLAQHGLHVDRHAGAQQVDLEFEQPRQALGSVHRTEQELVFAQGRVGAYDSGHPRTPFSLKKRKRLLHQHRTQRGRVCELMSEPDLLHRCAFALACSLLASSRPARVGHGAAMRAQALTSPLRKSTKARSGAGMWVRLG